MNDSNNNYYNNDNNYSNSNSNSNNNLGYSGYNNTNYYEKSNNGGGIGKILIILAVICAIAIIAYFIISKLPGETKTEESISTLTLYVDDINVEGLDENERYKLNTYTCTNDSKLSYDMNTKKISIDADKQTSCEVYFDKIEISELCANKYLASCLMENYELLGLTKINHSATGNQDYSTVEYRFQGNDVNNYIKFNDSSSWRIIGVFEVETPTSSGTYNKEYKVKIVGDTITLNKFSADSHNNSWISSEIKTKLNEGSYYNPEKAGYCGFGSCIYASARQYISTTKWYLGKTNNEINAQETYESERSNIAWENSAATWDGNVGLIYPSDYMFASSGCYNDATKYGSSTRSSDSYSNSVCRDSNWLFNGHVYWTISPYSKYRSSVISIFGGGKIDDIDASDWTVSVYPTLYLSPSVLYSDGFGTSSDPYIIK